MKTKAQIFTEAHKLAKTFEGDYIACFVLALEMVRKEGKKQLSIYELAEQIESRLWEKYGKTRIYLDYGYNTKKMKTTAYIFQNETGEFIPVVFIDCPTQHYNWINNEKIRVKEVIEDKISEIIN